MIEFINLGSGSSGNCTIIKYCDQILMIDAGFSGVELQRRLDAAHINVEHIRGILITHEHDDHIQGLKIFCKRNNDLPVYTNSLTAQRLTELNKCPVNNFVFNNGATFKVGPFTIEAFSISHDAIDPVGFVINVSGRKIGIATDLGFIGKMVPFKLKNSDILMLESNHEPDILRNSKRPSYLQNRILSKRGHLSNKEALSLIKDSIGASTRHILLAHLSADCNDRDLVATGIERELSAMDRSDVDFHIAYQDKNSPAVII
ncbi:MAG: MBL fold metallo-hydrolase [Lentisphaeria bacterium]|nr:MBL fold metallo-hydrolase [Lentisphaeria bacterium]